MSKITDAFAAIEDKQYPDITGIEWLDSALKLAETIIRETLQQINGRLAEFGNAAVLKTDDTET